MAWALGSSARPILTDTCGENIEGVFYLNSTPATGTTKRVTCRLRRGTRLLGSVGAVVGLPAPGESDEELLARLARPSDPGTYDPQAVLDGRPLARSFARSFRYSGAYTIGLEPESIAEMLEPSLAGQSSTRVVSFGWWLRIRPLGPGRHSLRFSVNSPLSGFQKIQFRIKVADGHRHRRHGWEGSQTAP